MTINTSPCHSGDKCTVVTRQTTASLNLRLILDTTARLMKLYIQRRTLPWLSKNRISQYTNIFPITNHTTQYHTCLPHLVSIPRSMIFFSNLDMSLKSPASKW